MRLSAGSTRKAPIRNDCALVLKGVFTDATLGVLPLETSNYRDAFGMES